MSCFMMNPESLSVLGNTLAVCLNAKNGNFGFWIPDSVYRAFNDCGEYFDDWGGSRKYHDGKMIAQKLAEINLAAFKECYDGRHMEDISEPYVLEGCAQRIKMAYGNRAHSWHYHLAKLLDCWLYQTCEGDVTNDKARLAIQELRNNIYEFIVTSSPLYSGAPGWGKAF